MICVFYELTNAKCECGKAAKWKVYEANSYYNWKINEFKWYCSSCKKEKVK